MIPEIKILMPDISKLKANPTAADALLSGVKDANAQTNQSASQGSQPAGFLANREPITKGPASPVLAAQDEYVGEHHVNSNPVVKSLIDGGLNPQGHALLNQLNLRQDLRLKYGNSQQANEQVLQQNSQPSQHSQANQPNQGNQTNQTSQATQTSQFAQPTTASQFAEPLPDAALVDIKAALVDIKSGVVQSKVTQPPPAANPNPVLPDELLPLQTDANPDDPPNPGVPRHRAEPAPGQTVPSTQTQLPAANIKTRPGFHTNPEEEPARTNQRQDLPDNPLPHQRPNPSAKPLPHQIELSDLQQDFRLKPDIIRTGDNPDAKLTDQATNLRPDEVVRENREQPPTHKETLARFDNQNSQFKPDNQPNQTDINLIVANMRQIQQAARGEMPDHLPEDDEPPGQPERKMNWVPYAVIGSILTVFFLLILR